MQWDTTSCQTNTTNDSETIQCNCRSFGMVTIVASDTPFAASRAQNSSLLALAIPGALLLWWIVTLIIIKKKSAVSVAPVLREQIINLEQKFEGSNIESRE